MYCRRPTNAQHVSFVVVNPFLSPGVSKATHLASPRALFKISSFYDYFHKWGPGASQMTFVDFPKKIDGCR